MRPRTFYVLVCLVTLIGCHGGVGETKLAGAAAPQYAPLTTFPRLGPALPVEKGVVVHPVSLAHGANAGRIWIYLPSKLPSKPMPCVFIAPAGVPPFLGNGFGMDLDKQKDPEHLPYVRAGFAVVAYDTDGEIANRDDATYDEVKNAAMAFRDAEAGMVNARHAIDYVLKMVPAVDPKRLYAAGHSSAGRISLLLAESDPRIAGCVAYAPVTDVERRVREVSPGTDKYLESHVSGFGDFLQRTSPLRQVGQLRCPLFLYHSVGDKRISITESDLFADAVKKTNANVTYVRGAEGDHYNSMIEEGVPKAIEWLRRLAEQ
jgi:dipeptidyl aminopeptidase/acylaminoacyl peptidase